MASPTVLFVPGLRDHVADHWQTLLQARVEKSACVPRLGRSNLSCGQWVEALDAAYCAITGPVVLVAHSAGVLMVAHWARRCRRPVENALLAAPPDFESPLPEGYPAMKALEDHGWVPMPRDPLPFPSIVAASLNDPLGRLERVCALAQSWGSDVVNAGAVGHLNPASGFGEWLQGAALLEDMGIVLIEPVAS
jgi:predicted alpha/beta hydrolase family esterase